MDFMACPAAQMFLLLPLLFVGSPCHCADVGLCSLAAWQLCGRWVLQPSPWDDADAAMGNLWLDPRATSYSWHGDVSQQFVHPAWRCLELVHLPAIRVYAKCKARPCLNAVDILKSLELQLSELLCFRIDRSSPHEVNCWMTTCGRGCFLLHVLLCHLHLFANQGWRPLLDAGPCHERTISSVIPKP